jgi:carboxyl-terminal processing protease
MMRNSTSLACGVLLGAGLAIGAAHLDWSALAQAGRGNPATADTYRQLNLFGDVFERVRADYVETPNDTQLIESAINGMLTSLDPHSSFLSARNFRDMQVQTRGEFGGLGIEVTMENGLVRVVSPIDETPAARAGVRAGDLITHLDNDQVQGLTLQQAVERMRGAVGSSITLKIQRTGVDEPVEIRITRDIIRIRSVRYREEGDVGYIRITQFNEQTTEGVRTAVESLTRSLGDRLRGYVIDLRNNPGGLLDQAIGVSDAFLERGEIVSTRGRHAEETQRYNARSGDVTRGKPIIVLINGGSASASEIVAGALQDHRRASVLGSRSFGKGSVQTIIPLGQNGAIRLTTARYFTPAGRSIQARGIEPDIALIQDAPEAERARQGGDPRGEASLRGHLRNGNAAPGSTPAEGEERSGSPTYVPQNAAEDTQLQMALRLMRGEQQDANWPPRAQVPGRQSQAN